MAFNSKVCNAILPPPTYENKYPHDLWIALVAERYFKTILITEPLILYRRHGNNTSNGGNEDKATKRSLVQKASSRFYYLSEVNKIKNRCKEL